MDKESDEHYAKLIAHSEARDDPKIEEEKMNREPRAHIAEECE